MKLFTAVCLSLAMVIGGSTAAYSCGGQGGATGCKVATMPLTLMDVAGVIRWIGFVIP